MLEYLFYSLVKLMRVSLEPARVEHLSGFYWPYPDVLARLESLVKDKRSSLFGLFDVDEEKVL